MFEIAEAVLKAFDRNQPIALATVIGVRGPSSVRPGAKVLVRPNGSVVGGLVYGDLEAAVVADCVAAFGEQQEVARVATYPRPADSSVGPVAEADVLIEVLYGQPTLLIAGAGHVSFHLSKIGKMLGFEVVVVDDRAEFANRDRFPEADSVIVADMVETLGSFAVNPATYVVLVIRGHTHDEDALRRVMSSPAAYIGAIGSRARARAILGQLARDGYDQQKIDSIHVPIGLNIGAQTPEEIALSIMAEIVKVRRGGDAASLRR